MTIEVLSPGLKRAILALLFMAGILNYMDRQIIAVLKPMLQADLGWSDDDYGTLTSLFQLAAAFTYLFAGQIVDSVGWRKSNPLGVGAWSLAAISHAFASSLGQFTYARIALGVTEAFGTPLGVKTVASLFNARDRSLALGIQNASNNLGAIFTPLFIPFLAVSFGWQACFILVGGVGFVWVLAWWLTARQIPEGVPSAEALGPAASKAPLGSVLQDRRTWAIAGAKVLTDQVWWFLLFWAPDIFHRVFLLDMTGFALPLALVYSCAAIGSLSGGFLSGRMVASGISINDARKRTMLICALVVLPLPLILAVDNYWLATAVLGLTLAGHQGFSVSIFTLTTDMIPSARVGTVISIGALCGNLAGFAILRAAGWWIGDFGYLPFLILAAISYLLALAWIQLLVPHVRSESN
jgi:ACS family hexuronate transporter-like MFS transporter